MTWTLHCDDTPCGSQPWREERPGALSPSSLEARHGQVNGMPRLGLESEDADDMKTRGQGQH